MSVLGRLSSSRSTAARACWARGAQVTWAGGAHGHHPVRPAPHTGTWRQKTGEGKPPDVRSSSSSDGSSAWSSSRSSWCSTWASHSSPCARDGRMATKKQIGRASQRAELQLCKRLEKLEVQFLEHIERMELQPLDWVQPVGITQLTLRRRAGARQQKNRWGKKPLKSICGIL